MFEDEFKKYMAFKLHDYVLKYNYMVDRMNEIESLYSISGSTELDEQISRNKSDLIEMKTEICDQAILLGIDPTFIEFH